MSKDPSYSDVQRLQEDVSMYVLAIIKVLYKDKLLLNLETFSGSQLVVASDSLFLFFCSLLTPLYLISNEKKRQNVQSS